MIETKLMFFLLTAYMINEKLIPPDDPEQVAQFLRTNPQLSKNQMGDYISRREHLHILKAFVESFDFTGMRIDASLRIYLETFRWEFPFIMVTYNAFQFGISEQLDGEIWCLWTFYFAQKLISSTNLPLDSEQSDFFDFQTFTNPRFDYILINRALYGMRIW